MNKVVLITGGARGIGSAIALELAKHGYDIVINYLTSKQPAKELKEKIESQYHVRCLTICADVIRFEVFTAMILGIISPPFSTRTVSPRWRSSRLIS